MEDVNEVKSYFDQISVDETLWGEGVKSHVKYRIFDSLRKRDTEDVKRLMKASSISPNIRDELGCPLLIKSLLLDQRGLVQWLLSEGADVNCREEGTDATPLHYAALRPFFFTIVNILIENGADINAKTSQGETPLDWAYSNISDGNASCSMCELLIKKGAHVSTFRKAMLEIRKFFYAL